MSRRWHGHTEHRAVQTDTHYECIMYILAACIVWLHALTMALRTIWGVMLLLVMVGTCDLLAWHSHQGINVQGYGEMQVHYCPKGANVVSPMNPA